MRAGEGIPILCLSARELDLANKTEELGKINDTNKSHQEKVQTERGTLIKTEI